MTSPDIHLSTDELRRHATSVDQTADLIDTARAASAHLRASNESYGKLVGPLFTGVLNPIQDGAVDAMTKAEDATRELADKLRTVASHYDLTDQQAADQLRRIR